MKMIHRADIYSKTTATNAAGQKKPTFAIETTGVHCHFAPRYPRYGLTRVTPTYEQTEIINIFFPADTTITYGHRIYNVTDRAGNVIDAGPFEITALIPQPGWSGKLHHYLVTIKRVLET
jgi:hypothetical protein